MSNLNPTTYRDYLLGVKEAGSPEAYYKKVKENESQGRVKAIFKGKDRSLSERNEQMPPASMKSKKDRSYSTAAPGAEPKKPMLAGKERTNS